jgi:hypothetical protein
MKKIALVISAATIVVASTAASAWGWGNNGYNNGYNGYNDGYGYGDGDFDADANFGFSMGGSASGRGRGYGNGYNGYRGYNGYGYAPYGYAPYGVAPIQPAVEMTEEQKQAIADQQAKYAEDMQKAQQQAAEFYATQRAPMGDMYSQRMEQREARIAEMDARMEEHRKAADARAPMTGMRGPRMEQHEARIAEMDARMEAFIKESDARRAEFEAAHKARLQERAPRVEAEKGA